MKNFKKSKKFLSWQTVSDEKRCVSCEAMDGKIVEKKDIWRIHPPLHLWCRCLLSFLRSIEAGEATDQGMEGVDFWLKYYKKLPGNYVTKEVAVVYGWIPKEGNLESVLPGHLIGGDVYYNHNGRLPSAPGRTWKEADLQYDGKYRGISRIIYSNDGLIFVTYDHYESFVKLR